MRRMNPLKYFWTNPYPESILWPIKHLFEHLSAHMEKKPISVQRYIMQCLILSVASFVALFLFTGTENPLEFFVDIPIYDLNEFNAMVGGNEYALYTYMFSSAIVVAMVLYLLRLVLFNCKEFSFFSVNGLCFEVMAVFVTALLDIPIQKLIYTYATTWLPLIEGMGEIGLIILGLILNFALYFVIKDSFSAILSSALALELIMVFQNSWIFTSNRLLLLLVVSIIVRVILELLDMCGLWERFVAFCAKWCYTPKYLVKWVFWFIAIIMWLIFRASAEKKKE